MRLGAAGRGAERGPRERDAHHGRAMHSPRESPRAQSETPSQRPRPHRLHVEGESCGKPFVSQGFGAEAENGFTLSCMLTNLCAVPASGATFIPKQQPPAKRHGWDCWTTESCWSLSLYVCKSPQGRSAPR